jgi:hypothetical protein
MLMRSDFDWLEPFCFICMRSVLWIRICKAPDLLDSSGSDFCRFGSGSDSEFGSSRARTGVKPLYKSSKNVAICYLGILNDGNKNTFLTVCFLKTLKINKIINNEKVGYGEPIHTIVRIRQPQKL